MTSSNNIRTATKTLLAQNSIKMIAALLGINTTHIYRAQVADYTPTYRKALQDAGYLTKPTKRYRAAVDVPPDLDQQEREIFRLGIQAYAHVLAGQVRRMTP